jgi:DNA-binding NtrC family response regulator
VTDFTPIFLPDGRAGVSAKVPILGIAFIATPDQKLFEHELPLVSDLTIGRAQEGTVNLFLADPMLSRQHVTIKRVGTKAVIEDNESTNGVFVEGRRVKNATLEPDSLIRIGESLIWYGPLGNVVPSTALLGRSTDVVGTWEHIKRVAPSSLPILVLGETGTGKDIVAKQIHEQSGRRGRFVTVNCAAVSPHLAEAYFFGHKKGAFTGSTQDEKGAWGEAHQGTLFLDEVGDLALDLQAKILRAVENREVSPVGGSTRQDLDVRIVAATNANLDTCVEEGTFRRDLLARLQGDIITMPPLRTRRRDVLLLFRHFMGARPLTVEAAEMLVRYAWPMNVREVSTIAKRMALHDAGPISANELAKHLKHEVRSEKKTTPSKAQLEAALKRFQGNVADVADHYGKGRVQIYRWMEKYQVDPTEYRAADPELQ